MAECDRPGCGDDATVRLHVPWAEDETVCAAHARALAQRDGVVATVVGDRSSRTDDGPE